MSGEPQPSWDLYRTFAAVLEAGSLSDAARKLGITQPTVTRHIDALEDALGLSLVVRTPQGISPTEAGLELRPFVSSLRSTVNALHRAAQSGQGIRGCVRVTASQAFAHAHLPSIFVQLRMRYPELELELAATDVIDDLLRRDADVAIRMTRPTQDGLVSRRVGRVTLGFYAHQSYLEHRGVPETFDDLHHHDVIGFDRGTPAVRAMLARVSGAQWPAFAIRTDDPMAQFELLRSGFGIGVCQTIIGDRTPHLKRLLPDALALPLEVWVVAQQDLRSVPRVAAVFEFLAATLQETLLEQPLETV